MYAGLVARPIELEDMQVGDMARACGRGMRMKASLSVLDYVTSIPSYMLLFITSVMLGERRGDLCMASDT